MFHTYGTSGNQSPEAAKWHTARPPPRPSEPQQNATAARPAILSFTIIPAAGHGRRQPTIAAAVSPPCYVLLRSDVSICQQLAFSGQSRQFAFDFLVGDRPCFGALHIAAVFGLRLQ